MAQKQFIYFYRFLNCYSNFRLCFKDCEYSKRKKRAAPKPPKQKSVLDDFFIPELNEQAAIKAEIAQKAFTENFQSMDLDESYESLFEILWYSQLPCFDVESVTSNEDGQFGMLKGCFWKGLEVPCSKIFTTFPTDKGI